MRNIKELLQIMLDNKQIFRNGLCQWAADLEMLITDKEWYILSNYIRDNKPKNQWYNPYVLFNTAENYYWIKGKIKPRISWLKHHISIN